MRQQILADIESQLAALGVRTQKGEGTDLSIDAELVDASFSTGKKKLRYGAALFASEADKTVYLYEKTTETSQGFSFGFDGGSTFQSGKTLFRKVKSVQYGPEGKVYEYAFDLGAIPKTVKEAASKCGWKFKTVLQKKNAMYPRGYVAPKE